MNHLEQAVAYIEQRIEKLTSLRDRLNEFIAGETHRETVQPEKPAMTILPAPQEPKLRKKYTRRQADDGGILNNPKIIASIRKLNEPFTAKVLRANGIFENTKQASNYIMRAEKKGWLKRIGHGQYSRTRDFGGNAGAVNPSDTLAAIHRDIQPPEA